MKRASATFCPQDKTGSCALERQMNAAAEQLDFERAARLRDDLSALKARHGKQAVVLGDGTGADGGIRRRRTRTAVQIVPRADGVRGQHRSWIENREAGDSESSWSSNSDTVLQRPGGRRRRRIRQRFPANCWCPVCRPNARSQPAGCPACAAQGIKIAAGAAPPRTAGTGRSWCTRNAERYAATTQAKSGPAISTPDPPRRRAHSGLVGPWRAPARIPSASTSAMCRAPTWSGH